MHKSVKDLITTLRKEGYKGFEDTASGFKWGGIFGKTRHESPFAKKGDGFVFSQLSLLLGMHDYSFPLLNGQAVDSAYTDGMGDGGIDGVAIAIGNEPIVSVESIDQILEDNPTAPIRILLLQAKLGEGRSHNKKASTGSANNFISGDEVSGFGSSAMFWLTGTQAEFKKRQGNHKNKIADQQWQLYSALREAVTTEGKKFAPEIVLLFTFGDYWNGHDNPSMMMGAAVSNIQAAMPDAVVKGDIWGSEQVAAAGDHARAGLKRQLVGFNKVDLPLVSVPETYQVKQSGAVKQNQKIKGFSGFIEATQLLQTFSRVNEQRNGNKVEKIEELDYRFFLDNPRFYLRLDKGQKSNKKDRKDSWNEGARSIEASLTEGQSPLIGLGHNGVVVVAREMRKAGQNFTLIAPQVVNGCQSCYVLDENRDKLKGLFLPLKIIITSNEKVKDFVIRASNTQTPLDEWSMLARVPALYDLQRFFAQGVDHADKIWLQRRWNDPLGTKVDFMRIISARQLLKCYQSSILGRPHGSDKDLLAKVEDEVFRQDDEPTAYKAISWLWIAAKKWSKQRDPGKSFHSFGYRHQLIFALWLISDENPDDPDMVDSTPAMQRYERTIDRLVADSLDKSMYVQTAYDIVMEAARQSGEALSYSLCQKASFTQLVEEIARERRKELWPHEGTEEVRT